LNFLMKNTSLLRILPGWGMVLWVMLSCLPLAAVVQAEDVPLWTRGFTWHRAAGFGIDDRFSLRVVRQEKARLIGECIYASYVDKKQSPVSVTIGGRKDADGVFWPDVISQVKNEATGTWETLSEPLSHGRPASITVGPGEFHQDLMVSLDVFKPMIGKYKFGRVVLKTGEAAVFELKDLLPPEG
jgi:hypothetical protein